MSHKRQFRLSFDADLEAHLRSHEPEMQDYRILSESLDGRGANRGVPPSIDYVVEIIKGGERFRAEREEFTPLTPFRRPPVIIGAGPGGLFCALRLAEYGVPSIILERGSEANQRMRHIAKFWRYGELNPESNVCYGEGGAGLYSDGKLITRIKSSYVQYVMNRLVDFGAPPETAYTSNPHLGSNKIRQLITKLSEFLQAHGTQVRRDTRMDEILTVERDGVPTVVGVRTHTGEVIETDHVILATGHSASDVYQHLAQLKVAMKPKSFAVGVRVEHPRELIDTLQYGKFRGPRLGAARYRLAWHDPSTEKGTYSFCMCPGGYVLSSGTDPDGLVSNGMSNYARNSRWSNSALVVSVAAGVDFPDTELLSGMKFQRAIEREAFERSKLMATGRELPAMTVKEFLDGKLGVSLKGSLPKTSTPSGLVHTSLHELLPEFVRDHLGRALEQFDHKMKGFASGDALLIAPETRTSAPLTILRDRETLMSTTHRGLYPCGEGAGHAGGITSAAVDGVKIAMSLLREKL
jgi:uncharacterized protein